MTTVLVLLLLVAVAVICYQKFRPELVANEQAWIELDFESATSTPGAYVLVRLTVQWQGNPQNEGALRALLRNVVTEEFSRNPILERENVVKRINSRDWHLKQFRGIGATVLQLIAEVSVSDDSTDFIREMNSFEQQRWLADFKRRDQLENLIFLREHVFSSPALLRLYCYENQKPSLDLLLRDDFDRVAAHFTGIGSDQQTTVQTSQLLTEFFQGLEQEEKGYLIGQLSRIFQSFGREDLAARLVHQ